MLQVRQLALGRAVFRLTLTLRPDFWDGSQANRRVSVSESGVDGETWMRSGIGQSATAVRARAFVARTRLIAGRLRPSNASDSDVSGEQWDDDVRFLAHARRVFPRAPLSPRERDLDTVNHAAIVPDVNA